MKRYRSQDGVAAMPVIFALLALIVSFALLTASLSGNDNLSSSAAVNSDLALAAAEAGAKDALLKISRNKDYTATSTIPTVVNGCATPPTGCATVAVDNQSNPKTVDAAGQVGDSIRKIKVRVYLDANGKALNYDWQDN